MPYLTKPDDEDKSSSGKGSFIYATTAAASAIWNNTVTTAHLTQTVPAYSGGGINFTGNVKSATPPMPPTWKKIDVNSDNPAYFDVSEVYETPANGRQVHIASLSISNQASRHHWDLFKRLHPDIDYLLIGVAPDEKNHHVTLSNVMLFSEKDANTFETWLEDYLQHFDNCRSRLYSYRLPPPPRTMHYSVQVHFGGQEDLVEFAVWMRENCAQQAYYLGGMLFFQNDEDAMLYKMKFEGK